MRRRFIYALTGGLIAPGAPLGLLGLRLATSREATTLRRITGELGSERATYIYIGTSTALAFAVFGYVLGCQADRLAELSETDALTGLRNARGMFTRLEAELARCRRSGEPLALLLIDLDDLKRINDQFGHRVGDQTIRGLARVIRSQLRLTDVGARWGGDEFAIVAPRTSPDAALALAERVRTLIRTNIPLDLTGSIGVAVIEPRVHGACLDVASLMRSADAALYDAKRRGKNRIVLQPPAHAAITHADNPIDRDRARAGTSGPAGSGAGA